MTTNYILQTIREHTAQTGGHETRHYLGMSQISRREEDLIRDMINGSPKPTLDDYQRLALGYETETNVRNRLLGAGLIKPEWNQNLHAEWSLHEGQYLFRGHTDGEWKDGSLLEIKSTLGVKLDQIEQSGKLPRPHFEQVQCYMHFGRYERAYVLYFARDTGRFLVKPLSYVKSVGVSLNQKAQRVIRAWYQHQGIVVPDTTAY